MEIIIATAAFIAGGAGVGFLVYSKYSKYPNLLGELKLELQTWKTKYELTQANSDQSKAESSQLQKNLSLQF